MCKQIMTCSQLSGFIAQLVEHCTGIAEVVGSNPVKITFQVSIKGNCLNFPDKWKDHFSINSHFKYWYIHFFAIDRPFCMNDVHLNEDENKFSTSECLSELYIACGVMPLSGHLIILL